jgi:hypothetical protein
MPDFTRPPVDTTRVAQSQSNPPDQSIYSNPITSNQYTTRTPSSAQVGATPNMQFISPNSLPTQPQTTDGVNPVTPQ